jgi:NAD(P)H-nitrite reductase large subunit
VREESWYKENLIDLHLGTVVKSIDIEAQKVTTEDGKSYDYEHLIMATGANPTVREGDDREQGFY